MLGLEWLALVMLTSPTLGQTVEDMKVYWSEPHNDRIMRCTLNGTDLEVYRSGLSNPYGVAIDLPNGMIYLAVDKKIQRAHLSDLVTVEDWVDSGLWFPGGMALDEVNRMLYWTDMTSGKVQRKSLDGGSVEDVATGEHTPQSVAVDTQGEQVYWLSLGEGKVYARDMALQGSRQQVADGLSSPYGIVVDNINSMLYWSDRASNIIQRWELETWGNPPETFLSGLNGPMGLTIDADSETLYWISRDTEMLNRAKLDGSGGVEDVVTAGDGYYLSVGFYAELEKSTTTTSSTVSQTTETTNTLTTATATSTSVSITTATSTVSSQTLTTTTDPDATSTTSYTSSSTTKTEITTTSSTYSETGTSTTVSTTTTSSLSTSSSKTHSITSNTSSTVTHTVTSSTSSSLTYTQISSTSKSASTSTSVSATLLSSTTSSVSTTTSTTSENETGSSVYHTTATTYMAFASTTDSDETNGQTSETSTSTEPWSGSSSANGSETNISEDFTGIFDTATTSIFDFNMSNNTTTTVNDTLLVIAPLLLPVEDDEVLVASLIGALVGLGAALVAGLFLLKKYGLLKLGKLGKLAKPSWKSLNPLRWCSKSHSSVDQLPKGEDSLREARRTTSWPEPEVPFSAAEGSEELLAQLQEFYKAQKGSSADSATDLAEVLEKWKQRFHGPAQVVTSEIVKEVLSNPVALSGEGPGLGGGRLEPVVQNAWQKHVRSADQLPQEKREELCEATQDLIKDFIKALRQPVNAKSFADASVLKDLAELRQKWRSAWPSEDATVTEALQSIEMAVTSAVIQQMYTQTSAELAESCSVKTAGDPNLPHTLESGPADAEAAEEPEPEAAVVEEPEPAETAEELKKAESEEVGAAEEPPQVQKSKSLLESLEEQMNNSKQKTVEMKLRTGGDQLLVELSNVLETRTEGFPAEVVSEVVTQWQQNQVELLPDAAAKVRQMAQLARSVISSSTGKDFATLRPAIEEAWKKGAAGSIVEATTSATVSSPARSFKSAEVLRAGEDLLAELEQTKAKSRSLDVRPELDQRCEEWKIQQLNAQQVVMESDTGRLVEGLADFLQASFAAMSAAQVHEALQVLQCTEKLFQQMGPDQDIDELLKSSEIWQRKQLDHLGDEMLKQWLESRMEATTEVLKREAGSVDGMLGNIHLEKLKPQIQELWLKPVQPQPELKQLKQLTPTSLGGAEAVRLAGMDAVSADVFETGEIFRQARKELFRELRLEKLPVEEVVHSWQERMVESEATLASALGKMVIGAAAAGQLQNAEVIWRKQMEKVLQDSASLMNNLDNLMKDSFPRLGEDLRPDLMAECKKWLSKHSQKDAQLYQGFVNVVNSVAAADGVMIARADSSFEGLRTQIQDAWRQRVGDARADRSHSERSRRERSHEATKSQDAEVRTEKIQPSKVLKDGEELLKEIEDIFRCSWARPGEDLTPEIQKHCELWSTRTEAHGSTLYQGFAEVVESVVQAHAVDGKVLGDVELFNRMKVDIKESWKHRTTQAVQLKEASQRTANRDHDLRSKEQRAPKTERLGKSQAIHDAEQLLHEMEVLFEGGQMPAASVVAEKCKAWRLERLEAAKLAEVSEMGVWLQSLMDSLQTALKGRAGVEHLGREEFARLQPKIIEQWKHQLHGVQHVQFDSNASQGRGRSLPRDSKHSKVDVAKEDLKMRLEALMQKEMDPILLEQKVEELVQTWQQRQLTQDVDSITASLIKNLAETARSVTSKVGKARQVAPIFEEAWKAQQTWQNWCPPGQAEVGQAGSELLVELRQMRLGSQSDWSNLLERKLEEWQARHHQLPLQGLAEATRNVTTHQVNSGRRDSAQLIQRIQLAWQQQMEVAQRSTRPSRGARSAGERGNFESQAEMNKRSRSRPKEGRPPEAPNRPGARSTERKAPSEPFDILDRLKDGTPPEPEIDPLREPPRSSMSMERGFHQESSRASRNNSPFHEMPSRGSSAHFEHSRRSSPSPTPDLMRLQLRPKLPMGGAAIIGEQRYK